MNTLESQEIENVRVLHQSIVVLLFKGALAWLAALIAFLLLELAFSATTTLSTYHIWRNAEFSLSSLFTKFSAAEAWLHILLLLIYGWIVLCIVLRWIYHYIVIEPKHIIIKKGILFTTEDRLNMQAMQEITVKQDLLGKLFNYGTIDIYNPELEKHVILRTVSQPYEEANFIKRFCPTVDLVHGIAKTR